MMNVTRAASKWLERRPHLRGGLEAIHGPLFQRAVDDPGAAASEFVEDFVGTKARPGLQDGNVGRWHRRRFLQERAAGVVRGEERIHFAEQAGVAAGGLGEPCAPLISRLLESLLEQLLDARPL